MFLKCPSVIVVLTALLCSFWSWFPKSEQFDNLDCLSMGMYNFMQDYVVSVILCFSVFELRQLNIGCLIYISFCIVSCRFLLLSCNIQML